MLDLEKSWELHDLVVIDVETLGLHPADGVCDIAAVRFSEGAPVASFTSLVNPGKPIPEAATAIHHITDAMVTGAPSLLELAGDLLKVAEGALPCAYSADFDRGFLHHSITGKDCLAFDPDFSQWLDVLVAVRDVDRYTSGKKRHTLAAACARRGITIDGAHRALPDAITTGALLYEMLRRGEIKPCPLGKMLEHIGRRILFQNKDYAEWRSKQPKLGATT